MNIFLKLAILLVIILIIIYIIMLSDTNSLIADVKSVMKGEVALSETDGTPLQLYNFSDLLSNAKVNVKITRLFVLHDFSDGYMWVEYSYETVKNNNEYMPGSWRIHSRWTIHKANGKWEITEIQEDP